jgi:hypothetical protein
MVVNLVSGHQLFLHAGSAVFQASDLLVQPKRFASALQGYLAHKKAPPPRTLQHAHASGPMLVLGGGRFLMSEVPLHVINQRATRYAFVLVSGHNRVTLKSPPRRTVQ